MASAPARMLDKTGIITEDMGVCWIAEGRASKSARKGGMRAFETRRPRCDAAARRPPGFLKQLLNRTMANVPTTERC